MLPLGIVQGNTPADVFPALLWSVKQVSFLSGWVAAAPSGRGIELASCEQCPRMTVLKDD